MEQKFKQKIGDYSAEFKNKIKDWLTEHKAEVRADDKSTNDFLEFIFDYPSLIIEKNDFQKRQKIFYLFMYTLLMFSIFLTDKFIHK
jgi:hypothetical protein